MTQTRMTFEQVGTQRAGRHGGGIRQKYIMTDSQRRLLLEKYDGKTETIDALQPYFPGIPRWKIKYWGYQLGLARQKEPRWTPDEIAYLERAISRMSIKAIARHLGRTQTAVKLKAKRLELNKTQEGYTMRGLCLGLGCDHHNVKHWITKGWLKGSRRHSARTPQQGGDMWYFSDTAIRDFVRKHPNEIDPRRADWLWLVDILLGGLGSLGDE